MPVKPFAGVIVMVDAADCPAFIEEGEVADIAKSGTVVKVKVAVAV